MRYEIHLSNILSASFPPTYAPLADMLPKCPHREELELVELGDAMANYDVDTWEAYQQVVHMWEGKRQKEY